MFDLFLKVYIISGLRFNIRIFIIAFFMIIQQTYSQQNLNNYGFVENQQNSEFRMNSLEANPYNYAQISDWEFSLSLRNNLNNSTNVNLIRFSLGKRINDHHLYLRYTPGIKQQFIFASRTEFLIGDSVQNYNTNLSYNEKYGFGYSLNLSENFTVGFSMRYFQQNFNEEYPSFFSDTSSNTNLIQIREESVDKNFWRGDIGLRYALSNNFALSLMTNNLLILKDFDKEEKDGEFNIRKEIYNLKSEKEITFGLDYKSVNWSLQGNYETSNSFTFGINHSFKISESTLTIGSLIFHDEFQSPYIAGIIPSLNYCNNFFSVTLSYLNYFSDRSEQKSLAQFKEFGIRNIQNNFFAADNLNLLFNFALSFKETKKVRFVDLETETEVFPTFVEKYLDTPIAVGKVVNISDESVTVKPSVVLEDLNREEIYSPVTKIDPGDTVEVPFFLVIDRGLSDVSKSKISQIKFYLKTSDSEPDDFLQRSILLHSKNNWDGKVINLRYFVKYDLDFSSSYSNKIIKEYSNDEINTPEIFNNIKNLFNVFVREMKYIADRRATVDYVQFPEETIELKGGDCDDLSVAFSSILESVGIQTAFIDYKPLNDIGHVSLLVNTKLSPSESERITINDRKYFTRNSFSGNEEIWIPIEVTTLTNFNDAWNEGSEKFYGEAVDNFGLQKNKVEIVDIY